MITALGGAAAAPSAVRNRESTTTMRVNEVIITRIEGASESTVTNAIRWITRSVRPQPSPRLMLMSGAAAGCAAAPKIVATVVFSALDSLGSAGISGNATLNSPVDALFAPAPG